MYSKCGSLELAVSVFQGMKQRSLVSWNVMMMAHAHAGEWEKALELLDIMEGEGFSPDFRSYLAAIYSCSGLAEKELGERVEGRLVKLSSLELGLRLDSELQLREGSSDVFLASALVDMYGKCGSMSDAQRVFDKSGEKDVVLWTALILGYAQCGEAERALRLFSEMQAAQKVEPNGFTYAAALNACIGLVHGGKTKECLQTAMAIHSRLADTGFDSDKLVAGTLLNLYTKCGSMEDAQRVFDRMGEQQQDVVSWTSLMLGYVEHEQGDRALELFYRLQQRLKPDPLTFSAAIKACGSSACLETGKTIHEQAKQAGLDGDLTVANSLIGFYSRCGDMVEAQRVFDSVVKKDGITWSALVAGYSHRGDAGLVVELFERMRVEEDFHPDGVTFLSLLTACSHAGLVETAKHYFRLMVSDYDIRPGVEHFTCMVDLLGRENQLDEAVGVISGMSIEGDSEIWTALLDSCRKWNNVDIARAVFEVVQSRRLQCSSSAPYILMASMYKIPG